MDKYLKKLRENLSLLIIIPPVIGGIWQFFELSSISLSYLRFFSVTQIIPDGIIVLSVLFAFYLSFKFSHWVTTTGIKEISPVPVYIRIGFTSLFGLVFLCIVIWKTIKGKEMHLVIFLMSTFFLTHLIIVFIHLLRLKWSYSEASASKLLTVVTVLLFACLVFAFPKFLQLSFRYFHEAYTIPSNLKNLAKIESKILGSGSDVRSYEILYFNDKYIFVEVENYRNQSTVEVLPTELLTKLP